MKKLAFILTAIILSLHCFAQQHYPLKNYLKAVAHPWDMVSGIGEDDRQFRNEQKQNSIVGIELNGLRVYNDVYACKDANNLTYKLSPEGRGFETDAAIIALKNKKPGFNILYCYQGMPTNFQNEWNAAGKKSTTYRRYNSDINASSSYTEIAHDLFVLASRGGKNKNVPDYPLFQSPNWWEPAQIMYKGAGLYDVIEGGNEWDNRWSNDFPLNGYQYAAAWSAMYDIVKKADPAMVVSTTGLCEADPKTLIDAWMWTNQNRAGKFPADIIQVHSYPWAWSLGLSGGLPGELSIVPEVKKMIDAAGGIPVDVGEWSWDIHPDSPINAPAFDGYTAEQSRGMMAIRTMIKFSEIGLHAAYWYRINQDYFDGDPLGGNFANDHNGTQFATSALRRQIDDAGNFVRTTVGDYFRQTSFFGEYAYKESLRNDTVQIHKLVNPVGNSVLALWSVEKIGVYADARGVSHPDYTQRKTKYKLGKGTIYRLNDDSSGVLKQQRFEGGEVEVNSSPIFFIADPSSLPIIPRDRTPLPPLVTYYDVEVYDILTGQRILKQQHVDIYAIKEKLPRRKFLVLKYWNDKEDHTEKIFKQ